MPKLAWTDKETLSLSLAIVELKKAHGDNFSNLDVYNVILTSRSEPATCTEVERLVRAINGWIFHSDKEKSNYEEAYHRRRVSAKRAGIELSGTDKPKAMSLNERRATSQRRTIPSTSVHDVGVVSIGQDISLIEEEEKHPLYSKLTAEQKRLYSIHINEGNKFRIIPWKGNSLHFDVISRRTYPLGQGKFVG